AAGNVVGGRHLRPHHPQQCLHGPVALRYLHVADVHWPGAAQAHGRDGGHWGGAGRGGPGGGAALGHGYFPRHQLHR
nr:hypothetical protein [Tanacetum cinerariifolium]